MKLAFTCLLVFLINTISAQSLKHPLIWVTEDDKPRILENIEKYDWARSMVNQLHYSVDDNLRSHQSNPKATFAKLPALPTTDSYTEFEVQSTTAKNNAVLSQASHAGMLYYLTNNKEYAQYAADILAYYIDILATRTPETTSICGNYFYDPRTTYNHFALAYDFIYNFLNSPGVKVYSYAENKFVAYDNSKAQKAIANIVGNGLKEYGPPDTHGKFISNHPILTAPGVLFPILCVDDDAERERLFNVFWEKGTERQNSFKNTILPMFGEQGIWPESTSYSFMSNIPLLLNIIDRMKPELNVIEENQHIFDGVFLFENLRYPDRRFVRFGDSKRNNDSTDKNYLYALNWAIRKGDAELQEKAEKALKQFYDAEGGRDTRILDDLFGGSSALKLFWGAPLPEESIEQFEYKPTVLIEHAGVALQRNYVEKNNEQFGLCGIIGGAHYVHSHVTGITMELYGVGYVMAPNAGLPETVRHRRIPLHEHYFRLYAGNNTVIVNGTSHGLDEGSWKGKANVWQNTTVNLACEPKHLEDPLSDQFSFATQFLKDEVNNCDQQRTLSVIRTSPTTAYYFDLFRSKSLDENKFHDYIYHNIGDKMVMQDANDKKLSVTKTDRYQNDIGDVVHSPGWRFFEDTKVSDATSNAVQIRFDINYNNKHMHMFVPQGVEREYTRALAPPTREAKNGYVDKKTQVLAIRQKGEAWDRPYIAIFEPSENKSSSVKQVEPLYSGEKIVGAKVVSKTGNSIITDYILAQENTDEKYVNKELNLSFVGRFGIVRTTEQNGKTETSLYIGDGQKLQFNDMQLIAANKKGFKTITNN